MEGRALFIAVTRPDSLVFRGRVAELLGWLAELTGPWRAAPEVQGGPAGGGPSSKGMVSVPPTDQGPTLAEALAVWVSTDDSG